MNSEPLSSTKVYKDIYNIQNNLRFVTNIKLFLTSFIINWTYTCKEKEDIQ